jgi:hypothetical protein
MSAAKADSGAPSDRATDARHRLGAVETRARTRFARLRRRGVGRDLAAQTGRSAHMALGGLATVGRSPSSAEHLLRLARPRYRGAQARRLIFAEPPYMGAYVGGVGGAGPQSSPYPDSSDRGQFPGVCVTLSKLIVALSEFDQRLLAVRISCDGTASLRRAFSPRSLTWTFLTMLSTRRRVDPGTGLPGSTRRKSQTVASPGG